MSYNTQADAVPQKRKKGTYVKNRKRKARRNTKKGKK